MPLTFLRRHFLAAASVSPLASAAAGPSQSDRDYWLSVLTRIADPVLTALSQRRLKATMPVEAHAKVTDRPQYTYLEALGRLLAGIAPWLELADSELSRRYAGLARQSIAAAVDPASPDFMNFTKGAQPVVDAAFLALAILRAPTELWTKLDAATKTQLVDALRSSRVIRPGFNNWLLFSATIEAFFCMVGQPWDQMRVDYAIREHEEWYKGDGLYGDGPHFHWDYYNSFVIQPMLLSVIETVSKETKTWDAFHPAIVARAQRYSAIQERLIAPDASYPAIGRSLAYRFGAFHLLALMALRQQLPEPVQPAQVRSALTAVMRRMIEAPGTFDGQNFLTIGFCGHQPSIGETYISTGSLYLCSAACFLSGSRRPTPSGALLPSLGPRKKSGAVKRFPLIMRSNRPLS
jgi:hypothetical protein